MQLGSVKLIQGAGMCKAGSLWCCCTGITPFGDVGKERQCELGCGKAVRNKTSYSNMQKDIIFLLPGLF